MLNICLYHALKTPITFVCTLSNGNGGNKCFPGYGWEISHCCTKPYWLSSLQKKNCGKNGRASNIALVSYPQMCTACTTMKKVFSIEGA